MKKLLCALGLVLLFSCENQTQTWVDLIIYNANIYTVDSAFSVKQSMAVSKGKIVATGTNEEIGEQYNSSTVVDAQGKSVFPGFIDAHCHFVGYGIGLGQVDLIGTKSFDEVIKKLAGFKALAAPVDRKRIGIVWTIGRGWDQNDWTVKEYPTREKLDSLYPDEPVFLKRVDGHAALVNQKALELAGITANTRVNGGEIILKNGKPTGVLIDNAVDLVSKMIPVNSEVAIAQALLEAQANCFAAGLTTVDDAGLMKSDIDVIDKLQKEGKLKMRVYAMLSDSAPNYAHYLKTGPYKTDRLNVRSFKFYGDGALGSRGACLLQDYADKAGWKGFLLNTPAYYSKRAATMGASDFQMNTHCIGDSAVKYILSLYRGQLYSYCTDNSHEESQKQWHKKNRRWRIEHFQVNYDDVSQFGCTNLKGDSINPSDFNIIPSIQPTHATSDMYWAADRLGSERVKYAYAYKDLLKAAGLVALGTDFPVEDISPFKTFYAAVFRKDAKGFPEGGFQMENALSREETIKGMTIWAAYANFEENEKGSLEPGKFADFIILDTDLMKCAEQQVLKTKVLATYIGGEQVYSLK
jgi:predicted amidohydrolase YtcJ